jgi:(5-formylfuran-3-yl)methyl phosphate synthase
MNGAKSRLPAGLLVSVRSAAEAEEAVAGGAAIIDVKEPARGPLGRADAAVAAAIAAAVAGRAAWTIACGELADGERALAEHLAAVAEACAAAGVALPAAVKAGPAGLSLDRWRAAHDRLAALVASRGELVAVAYADWRAAATVEPGRLIAAAADAGTATILIDTFDKSGGGLLEVAGLGRVAEWVVAARRLGMEVALAGRLSRSDVAAAAACGSRIVGVRSAACEGGRMGQVRRGKVADLEGTLAAGGAVGDAVRPCRSPEEISP